MKRRLVTLLPIVWMSLLTNCRLSAQAVGDIVRLTSHTSSAGVPLHPAPGDRNYSRLPNGSVATVSAIDRETGWYEISIGGPIGWVIQMYMTVLRPPTISNFSDQSTDENSSIGPISFTVADPDTALAKLTLKATSSNEGLLPHQNVIFGGSDGARTLKATPATNHFGTSMITVTVSDGVQSASEQFTIVVWPPKKALHLTIPEVATKGMVQFLILGGDPGDTAVLETSHDLVGWGAVSTNVFPATKCATCPFIAVWDSIENPELRFYRAVNR